MSIHFMKPAKRPVAWIAVIVAFCAVATAAASVERKLDPNANALIRRMSTALAASRSFSFHATDFLERKRADGTTKSRTLSRDVVVRRPDGVRMEIRGEGVDGILLYEAGDLVLQSNTRKVYARAKVPREVDDALDFLAARLRLPMPLADVLYSSPHDALVSKDTSGKIVGDEIVDGVKCHHLVFHDPVVDWEIWLRDEEVPLPARLRIVYKHADGNAHADVSFSTWNLAAEIPPSVFTFNAPEGYRRIRLVAPPKNAPDDLLEK
jgi:hypothetical protein